MRGGGDMQEKDGDRDGWARLDEEEKEGSRENIYHRCILNISDDLLSNSFSITSRVKAADQHENETMSYKALRLAIGKVNSNNFPLQIVLTCRREAGEAFY